MWHRAYRKAVSMSLAAQTKEDGEIIFPKTKEHSEPWTMNKETRKPFYIIRSRIRKKFYSLTKAASKRALIYNDYFLVEMIKYFGTDDPDVLSHISPGKLRLFSNIYIRRIRRK
jgi:hypothetical protein